MAKLKIIKKGKNMSPDGKTVSNYWFLIAREDDGFIETAIVKKTEDCKDAVLEVPDAKIPLINWKM